MDRLETLKSLVAQNPHDAFARYGLAMEYARTGALEAAVGEFRGLIEVKPDYCYGYFHWAQTLEKLGRLEEAREVYGRGIEAAGRTGNQHARSELEGALDLLG